MEVVEKLENTNGLQPLTSIESELVRRYLLFPFFVGTSILNVYIYRKRETAFEASLIISEIELALG